MLLLRMVTRELPTASSSTVKVAVPPEEPSREDAAVTVEVEAVAVAVRVADSADPALLLLMRTVTPLTLTELSVVAADRDTRVKPVRTDTLWTDARVMSLDVVDARKAMAEATPVTTRNPRRKKMRRLPLLRMK